MPASRSTRAYAAGIVAFTLLAACGQKPGVHIAGGTVESGVVAPADAALGDPAAGGDGAVSDVGLAAPGDAGATGDATFGAETGSSDTGSADGGSATTGTTGGSATTGGSSTGGGGSDGDGGSTGDGGGTSGGGQQVIGSDRTGADENEIRIGLHAPVTGAAPLPSTSFEEGGDLYWRWLTGKKKTPVLGREKVRLIFRDDKYNPSSAVQVCRELAKGQQVFMLGGGGGTDQIQACGRYANQNGVPYFSAGVTEKGLRGLPYYFATSMSYKQQGELLGQMVRQRFRGKKAAMIVTDTPNFEDAVEGWEAAVEKYGIPYYKTIEHPKGDNSWYDAVALDLARNGVEIVYPLSAPTDFIQFARRAQAQGFNPQFVGVGVSMGLNAVARVTCPAANGALFFSPFPGIDAIAETDPEFLEAVEDPQYGMEGWDDIVWALWGSNKALHVAFDRYQEAYGNDLTREQFRAFLENQRDLRTGVYPPASYTPQDHFGVRSAHLLRLDCSKNQYVTDTLFASSF